MASAKKAIRSCAETESHALHAPVLYQIQPEIVLHKASKSN